MNARKKLALTLALVAAFAFVLPVSAQDGNGTLLLPCAGESVSGTVVEVDEEAGVVTVDTGNGLCMVTLNGAYDHPIVALLGAYFDTVSAENLVAALEETQGCAVHDEDSDTWTWADCGDPGAVPVTVTGENEDGTFEFSATVDGEEVSGFLSVEDTDTAADLADALVVLVVAWNLGEDGTLIQAGDEIAAYHEEGIGFGVLVKTYAMAAALQAVCGDEEEPCGVTVEELVTAFQSGVGMGELFQEYGKPELRGVGHVRQELNGRPENVGPNKDPKDNGKPEDAGRPDNPGNSGNAGPKPKNNKEK